MHLQKFFKISEHYAKAITKTLLRQKMEYKFKMSLVKVHIQVAIAPYNNTLTLQCIMSGKCCKIFKVYLTIFWY